MGYTTEFSGQFDLDKPLTPEHAAFLKAFNRTRRMKRNAELVALLPDPIREAAGLPVGDDGAYYVGSPDNHGQEHTPDILDYNEPPKGQPGLWCQWVPDEDNLAIVWDEDEKFYHYVEWIKYLVEHFLKPWGYVLNGSVEWTGEDREDIGKIEIVDNKIKAKQGRIVYK